jgi:hypothetical protein
MCGREQERIRKLRWILKTLNLVRTADWRSEKAEQYPYDTRNKKAVEILGHLTEEVGSLGQSALFKHLQKPRTN